jgi:hypothetical protein
MKAQPVGFYCTDADQIIVKLELDPVFSALLKERCAVLRRLELFASHQKSGSPRFGIGVSFRDTNHHEQTLVLGGSFKIVIEALRTFLQTGDVGIAPTPEANPASLASAQLRFDRLPLKDQAHAAILALGDGALAVTFEALGQVAGDHIRAITEGHEPIKPINLARRVWHRHGLKASLVAIMAVLSVNERQQLPRRAMAAVDDQRRRRSPKPPAQESLFATSVGA